MEIPSKVMKFRFHILVTLILSLTLFSLFLLAPSFLSLLAYFWPLFLSTALFLLAVLLFANTSLPSPDKAAEGLLSYVAGHHDLDSSSLKSD
ncbi:hypothetical protein Csa_010324 [Cucumis sativus]|uniref:Transmembrane protein n=1 Tax=Cucumis sativus TaxID=3659 RepID=A0A0A0L7E9_CUCSA|nr:hypothetical protein Csa_010324 [Cucumis sativus]